MILKVTKVFNILRGVQAGCVYAEAFLEEPVPSNSPLYEAKATRSLL